MVDISVRDGNLKTIRCYLGLTGDERIARYHLFADNGCCISMYAATGSPKIYRGKPALLELQQWIVSHFPDWEWQHVNIKAALSGNMFIVESDGFGCCRFNGITHPARAVRYIHFFTMEDGMIAELREFSDLGQKNILMGKSDFKDGPPAMFVM